MRTLLLAAALALQGCAPWLVQETPRFGGKVVSAQNNEPVVAHLHFNDFPETKVVTSGDGTFAFEPIRRWEIVILATDHQPARLLTIEAQGFVPASKVIDLGGPASYVIALEPMK